MNHQCPCAGCGAELNNDQAMCPEHWALVPSWLRYDVQRYWSNTNAACVIERRLAIHNYRVARAAVKHVDALPTALTP
ncbi:hypothetical protein [Solimonas flava]|uniref:hypothetical protein n=1 Tax=Solimonas flava TaxID=415849 RepID=UPI00040BED49|nr:hypothetical protein [Solimonas flava]